MNNSFIESPYNRKEWLAFRKTHIESAGCKCERCGREQGNASLQIHHPYYESGKMPWEYHHGFCEVLCKGCHAREHGKIKPLSGWTLIHSDWDCGEPTGSTHCEHCNTPMEWHNDLWHPDWGVITVGYDCAEKLGNHWPSQIRAKNERMKTFIHSPRWTETSKGLRYRHGNVDVFVFNKTAPFKLNIDGKWGKIKYPSLYAAKSRAFLFITGKGRKN